MSTSTLKMRPYLSPQQLAYIVQLCEADTREEFSDIRTETYNYLTVFCTKMGLGMLSPAHISTAPAKQSMEEQLGLGPTPQEKRVLAYRKWTSNPAACTSAEIAAANTYRYENNMMTTQEEETYENKS